MANEAMKDVEQDSGEQKAKDKMQQVFGDKKEEQLSLSEKDLQKMADDISNYDIKIAELLNAASGGDAKALIAKINSVPWAKEAFDKMGGANEGTKGGASTELDKKSIAEKLAWGVWKFQFGVDFVVPNARNKSKMEDNKKRAEQVFAKAQEDCKSMTDFTKKYSSKMDFVQKSIA